MEAFGMEDYRTKLIEIARELAGSTTMRWRSYAAFGRITSTWP
jgi:hypothetical protein